MGSWQAEFSDLRAELKGAAFTADTSGYDDEVAGNNLAVRRRPPAVVGAVIADDVAHAVRFAGDQGWHVGVLNTGHEPSAPVGADTVLVTTRRMSGIHIDVGNQTARVEAGVRFRSLTEAASRHGLAPLVASCPQVGVIGYTLGGGICVTMGRKFGWAADHVHEIEVVTADGRQRRVSAQSGGDLFAALLGGGGHFGVVTAMEMKLFPVSRMYAGALFYSGEHLAEVLHAYRQFTASAPDEVSTRIALLKLPPVPTLPPPMQGKPIVSLRISYVGEEEAGARLIEPLRRAAPVLLDTVTDMPYREFGSIANDPTGPAPTVEKYCYLKELAAETVDAIIEAVGPDSDSRVSVTEFMHLGGAFSRAPSNANSVGARDAAFAVYTITVVPPRAQVADYADSGRELLRALAPWLHTGTEQDPQLERDSAERGRYIHDAAAYARLQAVKAKYDPGNMFHLNHNIAPRLPEGW